MHSITQLRVCVCVCVPVSSSAKPTPCISQGSLLSFHSVPPLSLFPLVSPHPAGASSGEAGSSHRSVLCVHTQWDHCGDSKVPVSRRPATPVSPQIFALRIRQTPEAVVVTVCKYEAKYSSKGPSVCGTGVEILH